MTQDVFPATVGANAETASPQPIHGDAPAFDPRLRLALVVIVLVGVGFRLIQFLANASFWLDEVLLHDVLVSHGTLHLLDPRVSGPTPAAFLAGASLLHGWFGTQEWVLRLIPLAAGLASFALFLVLARRVLSAHGALFAGALFAVSPFLIYYSAEFKQYSSDVLVAVLLTGLALHVLERRGERRAILFWAGAAPLAALVSLTSVFVTAGATLALLFALGARRERDGVRRLLVVCGLWAAAAVVPAWLVLSGGVHSHPFMKEFWRTGFMPFPPRSLADLAWYPATVVRVFRDPLGVIGDLAFQRAVLQPVAGMLAFAAGAVWLGRHRRHLLLVLVLPVGAALVGSALELYPFGSARMSGGRTILFLVPAFLLVMGEGLAQLRLRLAGRWRPAFAALVAALVLPPMAWAVFAAGMGRTEVRPLLNTLGDHWQQGDVLFVNYDVQHEFGFYAPRHPHLDGAVVQGRCARYDVEQYLHQLSALRGRPRVWVLFAQGTGAHQYDEKSLMLGYLQHLGEERRGWNEIGASLHLFDLAGADTVGEPFAFVDPRLPITLDQGCTLFGGEPSSMAAR